MINLFDCPDKIISETQYKAMVEHLVTINKRVPCEIFSKNHCFILTQTKNLSTNL